MKKHLDQHFINLIFPAFVFGSITGILTAVMVSFYKLCAGRVIQLAEAGYAYLQAHLTYLPVVLAGFLALSFVLSLVYKKMPNVRGGGIPTAIGILRERYPDTVIIGIEPALKVAADRFPRGRIGVMATQVTLREEKFAHQMERFPDVRVELIPAPGLVEQIEAGLVDAPKTKALLRGLLAPYIGKLDALVLGCTHYPFAKAVIGEILGPDTVLLDGGEGTARQTRRCLEAAGLLGEGPGSILLESSSPDPGSAELARKLLYG